MRAATTATTAMPLSAAMLALPVRYYRRGPDTSLPCDEAHLSYGEMVLPLPVTQTALVLVDVWSSHFLASHAERSGQITRERIAPVLAAARGAGLTVIHAPTPAIAALYPEYRPEAADDAGAVTPSDPRDDWPPRDLRAGRGVYAPFRAPREPAYDDWDRSEQRIHPAAEPRPGDFVVATGDELHRLLTRRRIPHLVYAGFAANRCIPFRDYGMRAFRERGYNLTLLRDCTTAVEGHDTLAGLALTRAAVRELEAGRVCFTATSDAFLAACRVAALALAAV